MSPVGAAYSIIFSSSNNLFCQLDYFSYFCSRNFNNLAQIKQLNIYKMRKLFLFGAMLVVALFANAQFENYTSEEKEYPVLAVRDGKIGWVSSEDKTKVLIPFEYDGVIINSYTRIGLGWYLENTVKELVTADEPCEYESSGSSQDVYYVTAHKLYEEHKEFFDVERGGMEEYKYGEIVICSGIESWYTLGSWVAFPAFVVKDGQLGAIDSAGNVVVPFENTYANVLFPVNYFYEEMIVQRNGKYGVFNFYNSGESDKKPPVLIPCEYEKVEGRDSWYVVKNKDGYGAYVGSRQIVPCKYESVGTDWGYFIVKHNGKYGVFGDSTQILPCKYERVSVAGNNSFIVKMGGKYGVYANSSQLLSCVYDSIELCGNYLYYDGYYEDEIKTKSKMSLAERLKSVAYKAWKDRKLHWFDYVGQEVSLPQTISDVVFYQDILLIRGNGKWGILNDIVLSAFEYDSIEPLYYCDGGGMFGRSYSGFSYAYKNGNKTLIDSAFNKIIPMSAECELLYKRNSAIIESWEPSSTSLYGVKYKNNIGKWGVVDVSGKQILKCEYDNIELCDEETMLFKVRKNGKWGMVNTNAKQLLPYKYDSIKYEEEMIKVFQNKKCGLLDRHGKLFLPCVYDTIEAFDRLYNFVLFEVCQNGKWGVVDTNGKQVLKCEYEKDAIARCGEGVKIKISGKWGMVDKEGKLVLQNVYEEIETFLSKDLFKVQQNGKWGLVDEKGFQVLQCIADEIEYEQNGCIKFVFEGKEVRVDKSGKPCN